MMQYSTVTVVTVVTVVIVVTVVTAATSHVTARVTSLVFAHPLYHRPSIALFQMPQSLYPHPLSC